MENRQKDSQNISCCLQVINFYYVWQLDEQLCSRITKSIALNSSHKAHSFLSVSSTEVYSMNPYTNPQVINVLQENLSHLHPLKFDSRNNLLYIFTRHAVIMYGNENKTIKFDRKYGIHDGDLVQDQISPGSINEAEIIGDKILVLVVTDRKNIRLRIIDFEHNNISTVGSTVNFGDTCTLPADGAKPYAIAYIQYHTVILFSVYSSATAILYKMYRTNSKLAASRKIRTAE